MVDAPILILMGLRTRDRRRQEASRLPRFMAHGWVQGDDGSNLEVLFDGDHPDVGLTFTVAQSPSQSSAESHGPRSIGSDSEWHPPSSRLMCLMTTLNYSRGRGAQNPQRRDWVCKRSRRF